MRSNLMVSRFSRQRALLGFKELPKRTEVGQFATMILGQVVGRFPAAGCAVSVVDDDGESLVTRSVAGLVPDYYLGFRTEFGKRITGWVAANRTTAVNSVAALDSDRGRTDHNP